MDYNIISLCDLHWGVIDSQTQWDNMEIILEFISQYKNIDLVVIEGDYFDSKLPLNSKSAILSIQWMYTFIEICKTSGVKKVRVFKGTEEHDNDQLEAFRSLEDENGFFKLFTQNTIEETLPELMCIYCPDENIATQDYILKYLDNIFKQPNIGFFHGNFDVVLPEVAAEYIEASFAKTVVFEYEFWKKHVQGPLISGHWHDGIIHEHLIYVGSYDRWTFNEEEPKGFGFIKYNTDTKEYFYKKIINKFAPIYATYTIYSNVYNSIEEYNHLIASVNNALTQYNNQGVKAKLRILINANDDKPENETFFLGLKQYYINNQQVKIVIKNKIKKDKKKEEKKKNTENKNQFGFVLDKNLSPAQVIQRYILITKNKERSIEEIEKRINKYIK